VPSNQLSNFHHDQLQTLVDNGGRHARGQACDGPGSLAWYLASGRRGHEHCRIWLWIYYGGSAAPGRLALPARRSGLAARSGGTAGNCRNYGVTVDEFEAKLAAQRGYARSVAEVLLTGVYALAVVVTAGMPTMTMSPGSSGVFCASTATSGSGISAMT
jgi:hypothetical protein